MGVLMQMARGGENIENVRRSYFVPRHQGRSPFAVCARVSRRLGPDSGMVF